MNRIGLIAVASATFLAWGCSDEELKVHEEVWEPTALELRADADADFKVGSTVQLRVFGLRGEEEREIEEGVVFGTSDPAVARIDERGLATMVAGGPVTFTAEFGDLDATLEARATCDYPSSSRKLLLGQVMPPVTWYSAFDREGRWFELNMADVHCDADWKDTTTMAFILSAGWCGPCTQYAKDLSKQYERLEALGMKIVIVEVDTTRHGEPADADFARMHLVKNTGDGKTGDMVPGIALGDGDSEPRNFIRGSGMIDGFPSAFVVRTRDMQVIADSKRWKPSRLPLERIAADPDADWSSKGGSNFTNRCGPGDEESLENSSPAGALAIEPGTHAGGICREGPDFYAIGVEGRWTLELQAEFRVGDLDLYVWDADLDEPLVVDGQVVASTGSGDLESIAFEGPAVVAVMPFKQASAPYQLILTEH